MRFNHWFVALLIVSLGCLRPATGSADDDPRSSNPFEGQECYPDAPPFYVVVDGDEEHIADRPGTGCQPYILRHPECSDCTDTTDPACAAIDVDVELCQAHMALQGVPAGDLYEACCARIADPEGDWVYRIRYFDGYGCPDPGPWQTGLPPGTGGGPPPADEPTTIAPLPETAATSDMFSPTPDEPTTIALLAETAATSDMFSAHPEGTDDGADTVLVLSLAVIGLTLAVIILIVAVIGLMVTHRGRK